MMADVLKNNLLEGLALSLVRSVTDIDEIWKRLRRSFGDPKSLVKKKLFHLGKKKSNLEIERFRKNVGSSKQNDQFHEISGAFGI